MKAYFLVFALLTLLNPLVLVGADEKPAEPKQEYAFPVPRIIHLNVKELKTQIQALEKRLDIESVEFPAFDRQNPSPWINHILSRLTTLRARVGMGSIGETARKLDKLSHGQKLNEIVLARLLIEFHFRTKENEKKLQSIETQLKKAVSRREARKDLNVVMLAIRHNQLIKELETELKLTEFRSRATLKIKETKEGPTKKVINLDLFSKEHQLRLLRIMHYLNPGPKKESRA